MSKTLWIARRFLLNERGHYTVTGDSSAERILVELDPSVIPEQVAQAERTLGAMHPKIQAAARRKWDAGEANPVFFPHSGQLKHYLIALSAQDLSASGASSSE